MDWQFIAGERQPRREVAMESWLASAFAQECTSSQTSKLENLRSQLRFAFSFIDSCDEAR